MSVVRNLKEYQQNMVFLSIGSDKSSLAQILVCHFLDGREMESLKDSWFQVVMYNMVMAQDYNLMA